MLTEKMGSCQYCGKQKIVNVPVDMTSDEVDRIVTRDCDCERAWIERGLKRTEVAIEAVLGEQSKEKGFDYEVDENCIEQVRVICRAMLMDYMDKVTLVEPNGDTIKLTRNGGAVRVARICKKQVVM